jgi:hypothetical protein
MVTRATPRGGGAGAGAAGAGAADGPGDWAPGAISGRHPPDDEAAAADNVDDDTPRGLRWPLLEVSREVQRGFAGGGGGAGAGASGSGDGAQGRNSGKAWRILLAMPFVSGDKGSLCVG